MEKEYAAWSWVTTDGIITSHPCELLYALLVAKTNSASVADIYDGENTRGDKIITLKSVTRVPSPLMPPEPIKCVKGLYIGNTVEITGVFIMWRPLEYARIR